MSCVKCARVKLLGLRTTFIVENLKNAIPYMGVFCNDSRVMATMNPGGDFGKRELSPALRSRFTEVRTREVMAGGSWNDVGVESDEPGLGASMGGAKGRS